MQSIPLCYHSIPFPSTSTPQQLTLPPSLSRPLNRLTPLLISELNLLHRFTYKNKNQHKPNAWWRAVVESDRVMHRVKIELQELLLLLPGDTDGRGKERERFAIAPQELINTILRLPRLLLLIDKALQVLLHTAALLDQLVQTRAFLPFSLTVVSVVARLWALIRGGRDDLVKLGIGLDRLVGATDLEEIVIPLLKRLPKPLRPYITLTHATPTPSHGPTPISIPTPADDFGAIVQRKQAVPLPSPPPIPPSMSTIPPPTPPTPPVLSGVKEKKRKDLAEKAQEREVDAGEKKRKKKRKKSTGNGDEIDDIFG